MKNRPSSSSMTPIHPEAVPRKNAASYCKHAISFLQYPEVQKALESSEYQMPETYEQIALAWYRTLSDTAKQMVRSARGEKRTPELLRLNRIIDALGFVLPPKEGGSGERRASVTEFQVDPELYVLDQDTCRARVLFAAVLQSKNFNQRESCALEIDKDDVRIIPDEHRSQKTTVHAIQFGIGNREREILDKEYSGNKFTAGFTIAELRQFYAEIMHGSESDHGARFGFGEWWRQHRAWEHLSLFVDQQIEARGLHTQGRLTLLAENGRRHGAKDIVLGQNNRRDIQFATPLGFDPLPDDYCVRLGDIDDGWDHERIHQELLRACGPMVDLIAQSPSIASEDITRKS